LLLVDDDANDPGVLFGLLERFAHYATFVDNGMSALALLWAEPIDHVLLDLRMPNHDGYAVVQAMKAEPRLRPIPVIVLPEGGDLETTRRCVEIGAADYVDKPWPPFCSGLASPPP